MNTLVAIGYFGSKRCYLNMSREEAIQRYLKEMGKEVLDLGEDVRELSFTDTFDAYDVWEISP